MLSIENPPVDASCSYCEQVIPAVLKSDERAPPPADQRLIAFLEAADPAAGLGETQSSHFSIRDYVFKSRTNDIETNWPFPQQHLQLCLKHGIRDLLPPFEPPDFVRAWHRGKGVGSEQLFVCSEGEGTQAVVDPVENSCIGPLHGESDAIKCEALAHLPTDQSVLGSSDQAQIRLSRDKLPLVQGVSSDDELAHGEAEIESTVTSHDRTGSIHSSVSEPPPSVQETISISESSIELDDAKPPPLLEKYIESLCQPFDKKCKLIVKLSIASEPCRTEGIVSNSSSVSDPMASKLCPVCKTFSSTSNTTLNAHIDQCLSVESSTKRVLTKLSKHKVKKRSMVDICATAPRCTLEDLDRRNGSNWASDLSLVAPTGETCTTERKRQKISPVHPIDDKSEGAVYVDSNGTKLRILSKFNDALPAAAIEDLKPSKFRKEIKDGRNFVFDMKKRSSPKYIKHMKVRPQNEKSSSFRLFKGKIHVPSEGKFQMDAHQEKEESLSQILTAQNQIKSGEPGTLRRWVCSKRSGLSKKLNNKVSHRSSTNAVAVTRNQSVLMRNHILKIARPSDDLTSSLKSKSMDILSNTAHATDNGEKHSPSPHENSSGSVGKTSSTANGLMLKLSRSSGNYVSSPRSKRVEIHADIQKSNTFSNPRVQTSESCHPHSLKTKKKSSLKKNLLIERPTFPMQSRKCNEVEKGPISKMLRKRRSTGKTSKQGGILPSDFHDGFHDSLGDFDLGSASNNQTSGTGQSIFSENIMRPEIEDIIDQVSTSPGNMLDSEQGRKDSHILERENCITLGRWEPGDEWHHSELAHVDSQAKVSVNVHTVIKSSLEKTGGAPVTSDFVTSEDHSATVYAKLDSCPLEKHTEPIGGTEAWVELTIPRLFGDQGMHCGKENTSEIVGHSIRMSGQMESSGKNDTFSELKNMESRTDTASIQGSSACLTSPGETVLEVPHENSSVTSVRFIPAQDHNMSINGEPSESPVSASSTISHLSVENFKLKDSEPEPLVERVAVEDKLISGFYEKLALPPMPSTRETERTNMEKQNQEVKAIALEQEPEKFWDDQPCCCSRREIISRESQLLRQSIMTGMTLPAKSKQMTSNLYIQPIMPSIFGTCSSIGTKEMAAPLLDSPTDSISLKASSDSAVRFPTRNDFVSASPSSRTQRQSTFSPVLRLMGKNLMVMNKEEEPVPPQKAVPCYSTDTQNSKYLSLLGFSSTCSSVSNTGSIPYHHHQFLEGSMFMGQGSSNAQVLSPPTLRVGGFVGTPLQNGMKTKTDHQVHQKRLNKNPSHQFACNVENVSLPHQRQKPVSVTRAPIPTREVIVVDDSLEVEAEPEGSLLSPASTLPPSISGSNLKPVRPFSCFPPQNPFQSRELPSGPKPGFPFSSPRASGINCTKRGSTSSASLLQSPLIVQSVSAGHRTPTPTLYYSPSLR